jgi:hypothetical protein
VPKKLNFAKSAQENLKPSSVRRRVAEPAGEPEAEMPPPAPKLPLAQSPQMTQSANKQAAASKYYRVCVNLKAEYEQYLKDAVWESRTKDLTQYINNLIEADRAAKAKNKNK